MSDANQYLAMGRLVLSDGTHIWIHHGPTSRNEASEQLRKWRTELPDEKMLYGLKLFRLHEEAGRLD